MLWPQPLGLSLAATLAAGALGCHGGGDEDGQLDQAPSWPETRSAIPHDEAPELNEAEKLAVADSQLTLGLDLYAALDADEFQGKNFATSPYSIQSAFGMVYGGTSGESESEMESTLHLDLGQERQHVALNWQTLALEGRELEGAEAGGSDGASDEFLLPPVTLDIINQTWTAQENRDDIRPDFLDLIAEHYDAGVFLADFSSIERAEESRKAINEWVAWYTNDLIQELIAYIPVASSLVSVNALYLKAPWATPMGVDYPTFNEPFTLLDGSEVSVPMMRHNSMPAYFAEGEGYVAAGLPLRGDELEVVVVVPEDFDAFQESMTTEQLGGIMDGMEWGNVNLRLPKFELSAHMALRGILEDLGMPTPFESTSDFSGIKDGTIGPIHEVYHQCVIAVDEDGIEAAAATAVVFDDEGGGGAPDAEIEVFVDQPFILVIYDRPTRTPLFLGRVLDPTQ